MKTDKQVKQDVAAELQWESSGNTSVARPSRQYGC